MQLKTAIPSVFNKIRPGSTILSVTGYTNNYNEVSNFSITFHVNYLNAVKRSYDIIKVYKTNTDLEHLAKLELLESYTETLSGDGNSRDTSSHAYESILDADGKVVQGTKWHSDYKRIYLSGFLVWKKVIIPGNYLKHNKSEFTIVKDKLRELTPLNKFRTFILSDGRFKSIGVEKLKLKQKDLWK